VLSSRQRRVVDALCVEPRFVSLTEPNGWEPPILGTLERRPPVEVEELQPRRTNAAISDAVSPFATDLSRR
jgi:hypothetical protein